MYVSYVNFTMRGFLEALVKHIEDFASNLRMGYTKEPFLHFFITHAVQ